MATKFEVSTNKTKRRPEPLPIRSEPDQDKPSKKIREAIVVGVTVAIAMWALISIIQAAEGH